MQGGLVKGGVWLQFTRPEIIKSSNGPGFPFGVPAKPPKRGTWIAQLLLFFAVTGFWVFGVTCMDKSDRNWRSRYPSNHPNA